jgi:hypothetical protein
MTSKEELKKQYKETKLPMGIFQVKNLRSGKLYIGSSVNLPAMINRIKAQLKFGSCVNRALQAEWQEHGAEAFEFSVLDELKHKESGQGDVLWELHIMEEMYLEKLAPVGAVSYR